MVVPEYRNSAAASIAFKFLNEESYKDFITQAKSSKLPMEPPAATMQCAATTAVHLPDVGDPAVQEYILQLLLDESFPGFVCEIQSLLGQIKRRLDTAPTDVPK